MMKKLIALVSTTVLTFTLCSSLARAEAVMTKPALLLTNTINVQYSYQKTAPHVNYSNAFPKLTPINLHLEEDIETFTYTQTTVNEARNFFFEFSITFNDKLQQLIAFFTRDDDEDFNTGDDLGNNSLSAKASIQNCKKSS